MASLSSSVVGQDAELELALLRDQVLDVLDFLAGQAAAVLAARLVVVLVDELGDLLAS